MLTHSKERTYACVQCQRSWGGTWSPTVGRKYTTVKNAESTLAELVIWKGTCSYTMGRSHTIAHNAIMRLHTHTISEITSKHIPNKSQNTANGESTPQSNHQATQEKNHTSYWSAQSSDLKNTWPGIQQMINFVLPYGEDQHFHNWVSITIHE